MSSVFLLRLIVVSLSIFSFLQTLRGQIDFPIHFKDSPLRLNPARVGLGEDFLIGAKGGAYVNYKNQSSDMFGVSSLKIIDAGIEHSFLNNSISVGGDVFSGTLSGTALTDLSVRISVAYHWVMGKDMFGNINHRLSFGLQAGYRNFSLNTEMLTTTGMYDPAYTGGINWSISPINDNYSSTRHIFDMAAGVYYKGAMSEFVNLYTGVSVNHITRPKTAFMIDDETRTPIRTIAQLSVVWQSKENTMTYNNKGVGVLEAQEGTISISGDFLYSNQEKLHALEFGTRFRYYISGQYAFGVSLHGRYENKNGEIIPAISFLAKGFNIDLGYEAFIKHSVTNMLAIGLRYSW